ncbi:MAG: hypothetical protein JO227_19325, partial [Acetobacteraceae bacterium]|nr:hypothetical protein [Acetobacteraceae bacterium]
AQPALLAHHCQEAGLAEQAVVHWLKAGQRALASSAMVEALAQLRKGLDVLAGLPDSVWRRQQELDLQTALASVLTATKGWSATEVAEALTRARELAGELDRQEDLVPLLVNQVGFHHVRSEYRLSLPTGQYVEHIANLCNNPALRIVSVSAHLPLISEWKGLAERGY